MTLIDEDEMRERWRASIPAEFRARRRNRDMPRMRISAATRLAVLYAACLSGRAEGFPRNIGARP